MAWADIPSVNTRYKDGCGMVGMGVSSVPIPISPLTEGLSNSGDDGRCLRGSWLGGSLYTRGTLPEQMVGGRDKTSHQQKGGFGSTSITRVHDAEGGLCPHVSGQQDSSLLHQSHGGDQVKGPMFGCLKTMAHGIEEKGLDKGRLGTKRFEPAVGHAVQITTEHLGIFPGTSGGGVPMGPLVHTTDGCIREQDMPCTPQLLQLVSRPGGTGQGRLLLEKVASKDILLSSCPPDPDDSIKDSNGVILGHSGNTRMEDSCMVGPPYPNLGGRSHKTRILQGDSDSNVRTESSFSSPAGCLPSQREGESFLLTEHAKALLDNDIRSGTHKLYRGRFKIFAEFCSREGFNPTSCPIEIVANFLALLKQKGLKYGTICGYRSAISRYHNGRNNLPLGEEKLIKRVTKACFILDPPIPRYSNMWSADVLMQYLAKMYPNAELSLKDLGIKTAALISILSISRQSSVAVLGPEFQLVGDDIVIPIIGLEKTSRPGHIRGEVVLPSGINCPPLSLSLCLSEYLARTEPLRVYYEKAEGRRPANLFVSTIKPHQSVTATTLAKWLLLAMNGAGIDTTSFKAHSTRSASASDMRNKGMSLAQVLERGYWSDKTRTFKVFYDRSARQPAS